MDDCEKICASTGDLRRALGIENNSPLKVLSIFGNTGDGKSHTLNHTFFEGQEVFNTSDSQVIIYKFYNDLEKSDQLHKFT